MDKKKRIEFEEDFKREFGSEPMIEIYVNGELSFMGGEIKGTIEIFRPEINTAIRLRYLSDEEWEEINEDEESPSC